MHIPDGFIPFPQWALYIVIATIALIFALRWARKNLDEKTVPLMAVLAAGVFVIMTLQIPLPPGISGHMVGAALIAIIFLSPWAAVIIISLVLFAQAFIIGDGGVTTLGANILNMAIIGGFVGFYSFKALKRPLGKVPAIFIAGWSSIFLATLAATLELAWAGTFPLKLGLLTMGIYSVIIGLIEGIGTVIVILALENVKPDLLAWNKNKINDSNSHPEVTAK